MDVLNQHDGLATGVGLFNEPTRPLYIPESQYDYFKFILEENAAKNGQLSDLTPTIDWRPVNILTDRYFVAVASDRVSASTFPSPAQDYIVDQIDFNQRLAPHPDSTFVVRANSLSMLNIGINIDDEIIVDKSLCAYNNDIIIAVVDGDFTVKTLRINSTIKPTVIWLQAENPDFKNIYPHEWQTFELWGVVTDSIKCHRRKRR